MKKTIIMVFSIMLVAVSLVTGTFAMYSTSIDNANSGAVTAKNFTLTSNTTAEFGENVKIAPNGNHSSDFSISNFDSVSGVTETDMEVVITITFESEITPLTLKMLDKDGVVVATGNSTFKFTFTKAIETTNSYKIVVAWPATSSDNSYIGKKASYSVSIVGTQVGV